MGHYRKKPVTVEARQWNGSPASGKDILGWMHRNGVAAYSKWIDGTGERLVIPTLEGDMEAVPGDYVIKGVRNEFYPCKADIFHETYEKVDRVVARIDPEAIEDRPIITRRLVTTNPSDVCARPDGPWHYPSGDITVTADEYQRNPGSVAL
jgi:hypothetical protein